MLIKSIRNDKEDRLLSNAYLGLCQISAMELSEEDTGGVQ